MPTAGFEPPSSGVGSNRSDNCAINTGQLHRILLEELGVIARIRTHHHQLTRIMTHHHQLTRIMTHHHQLTRFLFYRNYRYCRFSQPHTPTRSNGISLFAKQHFQWKSLYSFLAYQSSQKHSIIYVDRRIHFWHSFSLSILSTFLFLVLLFQFL